MDPHLILREKLLAHPELRFKEATGQLHIEPPSAAGFAVELRGGDSGWTVYLGNAGFHESFDSAEETLNFIAWCYSGQARVREIWRGPSPQKASLDSLEDGKWREISTTGYFFWRFWLAREEIILQNHNLLRD